jgi:predicted ATP-dependent endonuclease of OLD family
LEFDEVTILVGANGAGKSSVLRALDWLFRGEPLEPSDVHGCDDERTVTVQATFSDLSAVDRAALDGLLDGDRLVVRRAWSVADGEEVTATVPANPLFAPLRALPTATPFKQAYQQLHQEHPELGLPSYRNFEAGRQALTAWEVGHPEDLTLTEIAAPNLFAAAHGPKLAGRIDYILVPAVTDATQQTRDARGTLLRRLLDRVIARQPELERNLDEATSEFNERLGKLLAEGHATTLDALERQLTDWLRRYVDGATVTLGVQQPDLRPPVPVIALHVDDGSGPIDVSRQGHGVQRALMMALVQQVAEPRAALIPESQDPPALLLAIEEPELYQHPLQARHLAHVLTSLPGHGPGTVQVVYATHSAHFVDASRYERLRRLSKTSGPAIPNTTVRAATVDAVTERLHDVVKPEQISWRVAETLRRRLAEAVFALAVLLVEGDTDAAVYRGVADQNPATSLDATGVAVVAAGGKGLLPVLWAILLELGIPVYVVFDGDAGAGERMRRDGKSDQQIADTVSQTEESNRLLLRLLGEPEAAWPPTQVTARYATFHDRLEEELNNSWPAMLQRAAELANAQARPSSKNEDCYYQAALEAGDPPSFAQEIVAAVRSLANPSASAPATSEQVG